MNTRSFGRNSFSPDRRNLVVILGGLAVVVLLFVAAIFLFQGAKTTQPQQPVVVQTETAEPTVKMVEVLIPSQMIEAGAQLDSSMFRREMRPQIGVSARVVKDFEEIQGQFAKSLIISGQPLARDYLTASKPISPVSPKIPDGYRAVTISVDSKSAVEGWAQPGSKVDVSWISSVGGRPSLSVIVQNAKILSAEKNTNPNAEPGAPVPTTVTLLVTALDAQKIQLAQSAGALSLQLRGDPDTGRINIGDNTITTEALMNSGKQGGDIDCQGEVVIGGQTYCLTSQGALRPKSS